jgi:hypothetical protein
MPEDDSTRIFSPSTPGGNIENQESQQKVSIGGQDFTVSKAMADAIENDKQTNSESQNAAVSRIDALEQRVNTQTEQNSPVSQESEPIDYSERIFTDTNAVLNEVADRIESKLEKRYTEDRVREKESNSMLAELELFYADFFKSHEDLKEDRALVEVLFQTNYSSLKSMGRVGAIKELAEIVRKTILRHIEAPASGQDVSLTVVEGAPQPTTVQEQTTAEGDDNEPSSLTQVIKARKDARRKMAGLTG